MAGLFTLLERALFATARYGQNHPEAERQFEAALTRCVATLQSTNATLVWNVTPYGFAAADQMVWEPRPPFDRIPYQLFSDGVRLMGLLPGLDAREFRDFVRVITLDRARTMAPEDDFVTVLWEGGFEHVLYRAVDAFVEGEQSKLAKFEADTGAVVALAHFDTSFQLEDCWQEREQQAAAQGEGDVAARQQRLIALLKGERVDAESLVRAERMQMAIDAPVAANALTIPDVTRTALAAQLAVDTRATGDRFVMCVAMAWGDSHDSPTAAASVIAPLRSAVDGLCAADPSAAVALVSATCGAFDRVYTDKARAETLRGSLVGSIVSARTMKLMLEGAIAANKGDRDVFLAGLGTILTYADDAHVNAALDVITDLDDPPLLEHVLSYLARVGRGHEVRMGASFADAGLDLGLALIRVLSRIATPEARNAIMRASTSPHAVVRIEALSHLEGVASERVRAELKALLGDHDPGVRIAALRTIARYQVRVAGPSLVLRIRAPEFDKLPIEERRTALETLAALAPSRAEAVCLELLAEAPIVTSDAHEETRALAADMLGRIAASPEVLDALGAASKGRWRNSERVRTSASHARELIEIRMSQPPTSKKP
jgi:HEAT repeat protein